MLISRRHSSLGRPHLIITENRFLIPCMEKGTGSSSKSLIVIQRSDRKLWPFRTVHQVWLDHTSSSPSIDSSSTSWKRASGNSSKSLIAIQRSDRKLWLFRTVTEALDDHTSSSPRISSSSTAWKSPPKTLVKVGSRSNGGTKVMAFSTRQSSLARPDLNITENRFLIRCMEKGIRKLQ